LGERVPKIKAESPTSSETRKK